MAATGRVEKLPDIMKSIVMKIYTPSVNYFDLADIRPDIRHGGGSPPSDN